MFKNKSTDSGNNIIGQKVYNLRVMLRPKTSQRMLAEMLQSNGVNVHKNAIQRIESGERFVTDIEIVALCKTLQVSPNELFEWEG